MRVFLCLVNRLDLHCEQVDITAAFLLWHLDKTLYLKPQEGSNIPHGSVVRPNGAPHVFKLPGRCFTRKPDAWLPYQGLNPSTADPCVYTRSGEDFLMLSVHLDDQPIASKSRRGLDRFKRALDGQLKCSESWEADDFLGFNIERK
jgi:hypothetical protein